MAQNKRKPRRRAGRGVLWLIVGALISSALLRLGGGAGQAIAAGVSGLEIAHPVEAGVLSQCESDPDLEPLISELTLRSEELDALEHKLAARAQALNVAEQSIRDQMAKLEQAEAALKSTMELASSAAEDDLSQLTTVYESMKPKDAAALFEEMDPKFAAGFLARMRPDSAASILAGLDPQIAYSISILLAGRNAQAPIQ